MAVLRSVKHLNKFCELAADFKKDNIDLESFLNIPTNDGFTIRMSVNKEVLIKIIDAIDSPDKMLLGVDFPLRLFGFNINPHYPFISLNYELCKSAKLKKGKDFDEIKLQVEQTLYFQQEQHHAYTLTEHQSKIIYTDYKKLVFSFNGIKKLKEYVLNLPPLPVNMAMAMNRSSTVEEGIESALVGAFDFEIVYKKTKELHAKNRKAYLDELARVNNQKEEKPLRAEIPFAIKLYENKYQEVSESKPTSFEKESKPSSQNGMIIYKRHSGRSKTIISKNIEDDLASIMEDLETISISHFDKFTGEADDSDIVVIESIDKKDVLKAMKMYK